MARAQTTVPARFSRVIGTLALGVGVGAAFVTPASAATSQSSEATVTSVRDVAADYPCYSISTSGAMSCFQPYGEHLYTCDTAADGHHPGSWYRINGGSWHNVQYDLGKGNCADLNLSIGESGYIDIQACNYEGATALNCSGVLRVSANG
ncbi:MULTISPECIES: hypothetical protein [unclassified Streptomyces]|uniref:hypothetical protein n=1 Tax=unclassified Streptomyces TaxID=2593676 RepID=UPI0016601F0E|nr:MULTISPECIES: hypothetical protein [unclassified Streptomyces]MBD0707052.1 hypothetical protein [Streptomyces sp. CBMA291]MBD0714309.1 hypothetical protein [Streptomyces sp. CBMA370]